MKAFIGLFDLSRLSVGLGDRSTDADWDWWCSGGCIEWVRQLSKHMLDEGYSKY